MAELDFSRLPSYQPRRFVPGEANLTDIEQVVSLYRKLLACEIGSVEELETFLLDRSELDAAVHQQGAILYIRMTCQTDDPNRAKMYKDFTESIQPAVKLFTNQLDCKYLEASKRFKLDEKRYEVYSRSIHTDAELFREENVQLQTQEALLRQEYQTVCGAMTVDFEGVEYTMGQIRKFLQEPDRPLRESAWRAGCERWFADTVRINEIFDKMLLLRNQIALNAGFDNYRDYKFCEYHRFDYTPADCKKYHEAVEHLIVPLLADIVENKRGQMNLSTMRPWDFDLVYPVDPKGRAALKPFGRIDDFTYAMVEVFHRIEPEFGAQFQEMVEIGLLDIASRKGKKPGGYQSTLDEARKPFIFMNTVNSNEDLFTLLHEGGHAFHTLACTHEPLLAYRCEGIPIEFAEVASMSMELLGTAHLSVFYNEQDIRRSWCYKLEGIVSILVWVAAIDAFQHWLYENPGHSHDDRIKAWIKIHNRFVGRLWDWSELEKEHGYLWHRQNHIFEVPLYYIEYGIAQLGALQLWLQYRKDASGTLSNFRKALALGGCKPLPELFAVAGLKFDFSEGTIAPLVEAVAKELENLQE